MSKLTKKEIEIHQRQYKIQKGKWEKEETELLRQLIDNGIDSASYIFSEKLFPNKTYNSIRWKIHVLKKGLGNE